MPKQIFFIDFVKAVAILSLMVIHFLAYHLDAKINFLIWNWLHFVVVAFVFASGYLLGTKKKIDSFSWIKSRLVRLVLPFYLYLLAHYFLLFFLPSLFKPPWLKNDPKFIIQSLLLTGGVDFNWFVLLFVQLTLLTPFLFTLSRKRVLSIILLITGLIITLIFFFIHPSYQFFKWTMIFGWSFIYLLGIMIGKYELKKDIPLKKYGFLALFFALIFLILDSRFLNIKNLVLTQHKYPPDIIYLSYGLTITFILLIIGKKLIANPLNPIIIFLSRHSYTIFFANYLALDLILNISGKINLLRSISLQLIFVLALTLFFDYLLNFIPTGKIFYMIKKNKV